MSKDFNTESIKNIYGLLVYKVCDNEKFYNTFYANLNQYIKKLPPNNAVQISKYILDNKSLFFSQLFKYNVDLEVSSYLSDGKKLNMILIDDTGLLIQDDINTDNYIDVIYHIYRSMVRCSVFINFDIIKSNEELISLLYEYTTFLILKSLNRQLYLNDKQKNIFKIAIRYSINRFMLNQLHPLAYENAFNSPSLLPLQQELKNYEDVFKKQSKFIELFVVLNQLNIVDVNPNNLTLAVLQYLKPAAYKSLILSLEHLIALAVTSLYNISLYNKGLVDNKLQTRIENIMFKNYIKNVDIDTKPIAKILCADKIKDLK